MFLAQIIRGLEKVDARAAQCIDKEILIGKNGNIDIEIDERVFLILILIRASFDN